KLMLPLKRTRHLLILCLFAATSFHTLASTQKSNGITAVALRCEYLTAPLAIERRAPRLDWRIESAARGVRQTAYQIIVASSAASLAAGKGDLWDTGKVASSQTIQIDYQG